MKPRFLFCLSALGLGALASAQTAQSDITVPSVVTFSSSGSLEIREAYIEGNKVHVVFVTEGSQPLPDDLTLFGVVTLFASIDPKGVVTNPGAAPDQAAVTALNTAIQAINRDLDLIRRQRVGLGVYNDLVNQRRKALWKAAAVAKSMQKSSHQDEASVAALTQVVDQLEGLGKYVLSVRDILDRI